MFRASKVMYDRAANHPKIEIKTFRSVKKWLSDEKGSLEQYWKILATVQLKRFQREPFIAIDINQLRHSDDQIETDDLDIIQRSNTMTAFRGMRLEMLRYKIQTGNYCRWNGLSSRNRC